MVNSSYIRLSQWAALHGMHRMTAWRHYNAGTVVKKVDFGRNDLENPPFAAPTVQDGSARESHPETPNWSPLKPLPQA